MVISNICHCALVIMGELANEYNCEGVSVLQMSERNNIPQHLMDHAATRLIELGLISICKDEIFQKATNSDIPLKLAVHRDEIYITDIVKSFKGKEYHTFRGFFVDSDGMQLPQSRLTQRLNQLRHMCERCGAFNFRGFSVNVLATWANMKT